MEFAISQLVSALRGFAIKVKINATILGFKNKHTYVYSQKVRIYFPAVCREL